MYFTSFYYIDHYPNIFDTKVLADLIKQIDSKINIHVLDITLKMTSYDADGQMIEKQYGLEGLDKNDHLSLSRDYSYIVEIKTNELDCISLYYPSNISPLIFTFTLNEEKAKVSSVDLYLSFFSLLSSLNYHINNSFGSRYRLKYNKDAYLGIINGPFGDLLEKKIIHRYLAHSSKYWINHIFDITFIFSIQEKLVKLHKEELDSMINKSYRYIQLDDSFIFIQESYNKQDIKRLKNYFQKLDLY